MTYILIDKSKAGGLHEDFRKILLEFNIRSNTITQQSSKFWC